MSISITDRARENLERVIRDSDIKNPALRVMFEGFG